MKKLTGFVIGCTIGVSSMGVITYGTETINHTLEMATLLNENVQSLSLLDRYDERWFKIQTDKVGQSIQINIASDDGKFEKVRFELYDSTGKKHIRTEVVQENATFGIKVSDKDTYYLKVEPQRNQVGIEDTLYLSSQLMEPDAYENNDTWAEATPLDKEPKSIRLDAEDDEDWFKIQTDKVGQTIQINIASDDGKFEKVRFELYDSTGKKHIRTKVVEENESFGIKVRDKGTYYLKVEPQWGLSVIEDTLYLSSELMEPDAYENNDTWEEAKPLGKEPKSIRIEGENDEDWFKIETDQAGQTIQIDLRTDAGKFNKTRLEVYDDTLTRIAIEVAAEDVSFEVEAPKKGVYYLCVKNQYISDGPITDTLYINSNMAMPEAPIPPEIPQIPAEDQEINLPFTNIKDIEDQSDAVKVVTDIAKDLAASQKQDSDIIEQVTNFSEEAIAQVGTKEVSGDTIHITYDSIKALESAVLTTEEAVVGALRQQGVVTHREVDKAIKLKIDEVDKFTITVDPSMLDAQIDKMRIEAPEVEIAIHVEQLKAEGLEGQSLEVVVEKIALPEAREGMASQARSTVNSSAYQVSFNKPVLSQNISIALPKASGDTKYQAVFKDDQVVGGKYNPATNKVEVKSNQAGTYTVKENQKDFTDIQNKSQEMQEAIRVLASKGIINGKTTTTFAPDDRISRAEIATMIVKTVYKYDHTANAGFKDVKASDWYCAAVGSAKKAGIIDGYDDNTFRGNNTILKDQIIAITARVLRTEKHYKTPANVEQYLNYADRNTLAGWSLTDIALATRENLVVKRTDNKFMPQSSVTRGEAAIILKRLFDRI